MGRLKVAVLFGGDFLVNCFAALLGSDVLAHALGESLWRPHIIITILLKAYIFAVISAVILGTMAASAWKTASASWVWVAGLVLFLVEVIPLAGDPHPTRQISGLACGDVDAPFSCASRWVISTILPLRALSYSAGAWVTKKYRIDMATFASVFLAPLITRGKLVKTIRKSSLNDL